MRIRNAVSPRLERVVTVAVSAGATRVVLPVTGCLRQNTRVHASNEPARSTDLTFTSADERTDEKAPAGEKHRTIVAEHGPR